MSVTTTRTSWTTTPRVDGERARRQYVHRAVAPLTVEACKWWPRRRRDHEPFGPRWEKVFKQVVEPRTRRSGSDHRIASRSCIDEPPNEVTGPAISRSVRAASTRTRRSGRADSARRLHCAGSPKAAEVVRISCQVSKGPPGGPGFIEFCRATSPQAPRRTGMPAP